MLDRGELIQNKTAWEDLCDRALEANVYYSPRYARALLDTVDESTRVRFAAAWEGSRLVGLLPITQPVVATPFIGGVGQAWQSNYTFSCTPLLDRNLAVDAAQTLLRTLAGLGRGAWRIPALNVDGPCSSAVVKALDREHFFWSFSCPFNRAALTPELSFEQHMERCVTKRRRKDIERNRRRLEAVGPVSHEAFWEGEGLERAVRAFLSIEAAGWKGRRGTALACREDTKRFAETVFTGDAATSICRADVLSVGGQMIAVSLMTFAGRTGFTVKCCFDEAFRSYSAGLLLEVEVIRSLLSERWADRLDAATAGAHVVDDLWPDRIRVADLIFAAEARGSALKVKALLRTDELKRRGKARLKSTLSKHFPLGTFFRSHNAAGAGCKNARRSS